jgi:hypothetical protein
MRRFDFGSATHEETPMDDDAKKATKVDSLALKIKRVRHHLAAGIKTGSIVGRSECARTDPTGIHSVKSGMAPPPTALQCGYECF